MQNLPKYIFQAVSQNKTSLGDNPAFPPEDESKFLCHLLSKKYSQLKQEIGDLTTDELKLKLSQSLSLCRKLESANKESLTNLCDKVLKQLFKIPSETIDIQLKLVRSVDVSNQRDIPEPTEDYTFDDMQDAKNLTGEIYKRRLLNALIYGASISYSSKIASYISDLFDINEDLPALYKKILTYNNLLIFYEKEKLIDNKATVEGGKVDVYLGNENTMTRIEAEGIIFPILLEEAIRGILEVAISHGLPEQKTKAEYVTKKADFRLAELWDMRLGLPLWELVYSQMDRKIEPNFLLMELAKLPVDEFNNTMQEIFAKTNKGKSLLDDILSDISYKQEQDNFNDYLQTQNNKYPIDDQLFFTSDELLSEIDDDI